MTANRVKKESSTTEVSAESGLISSISFDALRKLLQDAGYRAEMVSEGGSAVLRSSTNGVAFDVRLGNRLSGDADGAVDFALVAVLRIDGEFPLAIVNRWNETRRFGRLQIARNCLLLTMDVLVAGGVTMSHVRAQIEIWDRLVQELMLHLRAELGKPAEAAAGDAKALQASA